MQARNIEFAIYNSAISMDGRKIFKTIKKPQDLYQLPSEIEQKKKKSKEIVVDLEAAEKAFAKPHKKPKWLTQQKD